MSDPLHPTCAECGAALNPVEPACSHSEAAARSLGVDRPMKLARRLLFLETVVAGLVASERQRRERKPRKQRKSRGKTPRDTYAAFSD